MPSASDLDYEHPVGLSSKQVESIAIIGGGASAAIILDTLLKEPDSNIKQITIYERQDKLGGVWYFNPETIETPNHIIKSGNINFENDPQLPNPFEGNLDKDENELNLPRINQERFLQTPSYYGIKTNIIEKMMTYSDNKNWGIDGDDEDRKYVVGTVVQKYIDSYIDKNLNDPRVKLHLNSTVEDVERIDRHDEVEIPYKFRLTIREELPNSEKDRWYRKNFDSVIVASGHYHVPFIPHVPGLKQLQETYPKVVQHAKFYRSSESYKDKTAIVVGSRASGSDLTKFIAREPGTKVYQSIRNYERTKVLSSRTNVETKPEITSIVLLDESEPYKIKVLFEDGSIVYDPDHIVYCTGYLFSYPFLNRLFNNKITHEGQTVSNLYQHTFLINEPLITIIGVPIDGISFRVFEYQAILLSRYITGKINLPSRKEQTEWVNKRYEEKSNTRLYHTIGVVDALPFAQTLIRLGQVSAKTKVGREFPILTEEEVLIYREAGEKLRKFWDER
ncbi:uncharacterized protein KGF55_000735 [Candida pseudojiufengensis]|uniref:uncharacterized protein n=1 Tax=Candida pseudojiufengensis TaxID=497109 RepID=UPI002224738A|nr:uncharacterized protein KGF55_000735 [Candida pseudojiufengensis]KAI5966426.1 hypothetical protein KGF55_000735 [Candida pseudojiufengensis]